MMKRSLLNLLLVFSPMVWAAGFGINQTRVVFRQANKSVMVTYRNTTATTPYLVQSWVSDKDNRVANTFAVVPPLVRLEPSSEGVVKLLPLPAIARLPQDRESLFYLTAKAIAPSSPLSREGVNFSTGAAFKAAVSITIKLFYRPTHLLVSQSDAFAHLHFSRKPGQLIAHNDSPYYLVLSSLSFSGRAASLVIGENDVIAPFSQQAYATTGFADNASWTVLDDNGNNKTFSGVIGQ